MNESVLVERPAPGVALIRLNRPKARNALNQEVRAALAEQQRQWVTVTRALGGVWGGHFRLPSMATA